MMHNAGLRVSVNRWYDWEKIGTHNDPRKRKTRLKESEAKKKEQAKAQGKEYTPKRETTYHPPWPDELAVIESQLGIRSHWLITGEGSPFVEERKQRATDTDPVFAALATLYETLTEGQKSAIQNVVESFKPGNRHPND